jgi:hypothetical protein
MKGTSSPTTSGIRLGATILAGFVSAVVAIAVIRCRDVLEYKKPRQ